MIQESTVIELCCADIHAVQTAEICNIPAIELCMDLDCGGLTPSNAMLHLSRRLFSGELGMLIRPRKGNFHYSTLEKALMLDEISRGLDAGVDAIVIGALCEDGTLDQNFMEQIVRTSMGATLVFHRAIDTTPHVEEIIFQLADYQFDRVLSSGGKHTAAEGSENLKKWNQILNQQIEWVAGGKIDAGNVKQILQESGCRRIHCALRSSGDFTESVLDLGVPDALDLNKLKALLKILGNG